MKYVLLAGILAKLRAPFSAGRFAGQVRGAAGTSEACSTASVFARPVIIEAGHSDSCDEVCRE